MSWNEAAGSAWFWALVIGGLAVVYFLPTIVGLIRQVEHLAIIVMLNMFPIAWPAALAGAFILPRRQSPVPNSCPHGYQAYYAPAQYPPPGPYY